MSSTSTQGATEEELKWAAQVKQAAQASTKIDSEVICDLEFLQHAILSKGNVERALDRVLNMQKMRRQHGISARISYEDAVRDTKTFLREFPHVCLSMGTLEDQSELATVDVAKCFAKDLQADERISIIVRFFYHWLGMCQSNIGAIRGGISVMMDSKGMRYENVSIKLEKQLAFLYSRAYPVRLKMIASLNTPFLVRSLIILLMRLFVSKKIRERHFFCPDADTFLKSSGYPKDVLPIEWHGTMSSGKLEKIMLERLRERCDLAEKFKL